MPTDLEIVLKDFITTQRAFNKIVEEKLEKLDSLVSKVENLAHDVEILKIRTTHVVGLARQVPPFGRLSCGAIAI